MTRPALILLAGVTLVQQLPELPNDAVLLAGGLSAVILAGLRFHRCLLFLAGLLWAVAFAHHRLSNQLSPALEGLDIRLQGQISGLPDYRNNRIRFDFVVTPERAGFPRKIRLSWHRSEQPVKAGQYWLFTVRLKRPHGTVNPGGFDYERWLMNEGIGATGYVRKDPKPELLKRAPPRFQIDVWRQAISDRLSGRPDGNSIQALIKALTIGDGSGISQNQWRLFRETGTTHLVVISGSHIALVAGFVYLLVRKFWAWTGNLRWPPQRIAAVSAMAAAFLYSALAGFSIPTQRAMIMLTMVMISTILQRNTRPMHTLSVALAAVLVFDPMAIGSTGFWLSFIAVGLMVLAMAGRLNKSGYMIDAVKLHWFAALGLSPVLLLYFQQISIIAPLANLLAAPVISLLAVPLSLLAVGVMWVLPGLADGLIDLAGLLLKALLRLLATMADLPSATIAHPAPAIWALLIAIPGILLILAPLGTPARCLSLFLLLPMVAPQSDRLKPGEFRLTLLDVGQGLAAAVQTENHWLIYDTGPRYSEDSDMGQLVLLPFLRTQGVNRIDRLIVSHGDNDHIGGAQSLIGGIAVENVMTSVPEQLAAYAPVRCISGQTWHWDKVTFRILAPMAGWTGAGNDNSCVLKIESDHGSILLPGDIEAGTESWLAQNYGQDLRADILIAPHHGSKTSSTDAFLRMVRPRQVLIPSGYRNQFGHPHPDVLERYRGLKAKWRASSDNGAIEVDIMHRAAAVSSLRQKERRYWRNP